MFGSVPPHLRTIKFKLQSYWTPPNIKELGEVLNEYEGIFSKSETDVGHCTTISLKIELEPNTAPITPRPYLPNPVTLKQIDEIFGTYLKAGLIKPSTSAWCFPLPCTPKKDCSFWITVNNKQLNTPSVVGKYPLSMADDLIDVLGTEKNFSTFGLLHGSWKRRFYSFRHPPSPR